MQLEYLGVFSGSMAQKQAKKKEYWYIWFMPKQQRYIIKTLDQKSDIEPCYITALQFGINFFEEKGITVPEPELQNPDSLKFYKQNNSPFEPDQGDHFVSTKQKKTDDLDDIFDFDLDKSLQTESPKISINPDDSEQEAQKKPAKTTLESKDSAQNIAKSDNDSNDISHIKSSPEEASLKKPAQQSGKTVEQKQNVSVVSDSADDPTNDLENFQLPDDLITEGIIDFDLELGLDDLVTTKKPEDDLLLAKKTAECKRLDEQAAQLDEDMRNDLATAISSWKKGKKGVALAKIDELYNRKENFIKAHKHTFTECAIQLRKINQNEKALAFAIRCTELAPDDSHTFFNVARMYYELKNYKNALKFAQKAITLDLKLKHAVRLEGLINKLLGKSSK